MPCMPSAYFSDPRLSSLHCLRRAFGPVLHSKYHGNCSSWGVNEVTVTVGSTSIPAELCLPFLDCLNLFVGKNREPPAMVYLHV